MSLIDPDWIDPIEATFDAEKPIRQEQGLMLAGNPIAMAAGKANAPRVAQKVILPTGISAPFTFSGFSGWQGAIFNLSNPVTIGGGGSSAFSVAVQLGDGSDFATSKTLISESGTAVGFEICYLFIDFTTGNASFSYDGAFRGNGTDTIELPSGDVTEVRISGGATGMVIANGGASAS